MKNVVLLQKDVDGNIFCRQITKKGIEYMMDCDSYENEHYWEEGGTILLEELEEILDKEI